MSDNGNYWRSKILIFDSLRKRFCIRFPLLDYVWLEIFWNISTQFSFDLYRKPLSIIQILKNGHILNTKSIVKNPKTLFLANFQSLMKQGHLLILFSPIWLTFKPENIRKLPHLVQMANIEKLEDDLYSSFSSKRRDYFRIFKIFLDLLHFGPFWLFSRSQMDKKGLSYFFLPQILLNPS